MDYKESILRTLKELEKLDSGDGETKKLIIRAKAAVERETSQHHLFVMHQTLAEILDKEKGGKGESPFMVRMPTGKKVEFKTLDEMNQKMGEGGIE